MHCSRSWGLFFGRLCCSDLLFREDHYLSKVLVQKMNIDCESTIEKGYFDNAKRIMKTDPCCYYCGVEGSSVLGLTKLRERCVTKGYDCFPICVECLDVKKKKLVTNGEDCLVKKRGVVKISKT